jgi:hypothetical protein
MLKEVELSRRSKAWELGGLPKGKKAKGLQIGLQEDRVIRKSCMVNETGWEAF